MPNNFAQFRSGRIPPAALVDAQGTTGFPMKKIEHAARPMSDMV
jgi:hypothetical protein